jgi:hypothetical protein
MADILQKIIGANSIKNGSAVVSVSKSNGSAGCVLDGKFNQISQVANVSGELLYKYNQDNINTVPMGVAAGTGTVVSAIPSQKIEVTSYVFLTDAASTVTFLSDSTPISSGMTFDINAGVSSEDDNGLLTTEAGEALRISTTAGNLNGHISYRIK